jgi:hypothetical protein
MTIEMMTAELPKPALLDFPVILMRSMPKAWADAMSEAKRASDLARRGRWKEASERYLWIARTLEQPVRPFEVEFDRGREIAYENAALCSRRAWLKTN